MRHTKENCTASNQIIADICGLACANCGACKCGKCEEKKEILDWNDLPYGNKYRALYKALEIRIDLRDRFMGRTLREWTDLYRQDKHLNNVPLAGWDIQAQRLQIKRGNRNPMLKDWNLSPAEWTSALKQAVEDQILIHRIDG